MIKAIIFDFFGVICSDDYWNFVKQDHQDDLSFRTYAEEVNLGEIPWHDFVEKIAVATGKTVQEVNTMYESERIDPRMVGMIHELHKNYKTALLTNAHHEFIDGLLSTHKLHNLFDELVVSSRVGMIKPDLEIFELALEKLGVEGSEAIYIDDLIRHTNAAGKVGMQTILFSNFEQCQHDLAGLLSHA